MVVTGESGSGKSFNAKKALEYLAYRVPEDRACYKPDVPSITERMLAANTILEAFGNASMPRNPDSSRFGKLFQVESCIIE